MKVTTLVWTSLAFMAATAAVVWTVTPPGGAGALVAPAMAREPPLVAEVRSDAPLAYYRLRERTVGEPVLEEIHGLHGVHDGAPGQVYLAHRELVLPGGAFSIEAWIRPAVFDTKHRGIVDVEWPAAPNGVQGYRMYTSRQGGVAALTFGRIERSTLQDVVIRFPDDGRMHHVVGTFDGGTNVCIYVDAERQCAVHVPLALVGRGSIATIGKRIFSADQAFDGEIRDVAFYDRELPERRVTAHLRAGPP